MYFCTECKSYFSQKRKVNQKKLRREYSEKKQTQQQIAQEIGRSRKWVNEHLQTPAPVVGKNTSIQPQKIVLIVDTTYFRQFGLMVFRASNLGKNLLWKVVDHENIDLEFKSL